MENEGLFGVGERTLELEVDRASSLLQPEQYMLADLTFRRSLQYHAIQCREQIIEKYNNVSQSIVG